MKKSTRKEYQQPEAEHIHLSSYLSVLETYSLYEDIEDYEIGGDL